MMHQPQGVQDVQRAVDAMMQSLGRSHLIPSQREAFLCCASCCDDPNARPEQIQNWYACVFACLRAYRVASHILLASLSLDGCIKANGAQPSPAGSSTCDQCILWLLTPTTHREAQHAPLVSAVSPLAAVLSAVRGSRCSNKKSSRA